MNPAPKKRSSKAVLRQRPGRPSSFRKRDAGSDFAGQLLTRRYLFPPSSHSAKDLAVHLEHEGTGYWFPLGTAEHGSAVAAAKDIYANVLERGWEFACHRFSRELIIGFEWCSQPLLWTYTTIHTLPGEQGGYDLPTNHSTANPVLLLEEDAGIRRALAWCINQHAGSRAITCDSTEAVGQFLANEHPRLVLLNRNLAERLGFESPGQIAPLRPGVSAVTYSVAADGDKLFVSTPGGASGYMLKRVAPAKILEPILPWGVSETTADEMMSRVRNSFKELLSPRDSGNDSGLARLTRREHEVLLLLSKGFVDKEIAQSLGISTWTVHGHVKSIFERLNVRTRTEAAVRFLEK